MLVEQLMLFQNIQNGFAIANVWEMVVTDFTSSLSFIIDCLVTFLTIEIVVIVLTTEGLWTSIQQMVTVSSFRNREKAESNQQTSQRGSIGNSHNE